MNLNTWKIFSATPHRMFFFGGVMQALLAVGWWLMDLGGRYGGYIAPREWGLAATDIHAFLMVYGFFSFFIFGFLMTTYPRWMNGAEVERSYYVPAFVLLFGGILLFYVVVILAKPLLVLAAVLFLAGWGMALAGLLKVYLRAKHPDKRHATITSIVLILGLLLAVGWFVGVMAGLSFPLALAKVGGIWILLLPVFFAVSHRMIPFFSANAIPDYRIVRPDWALLFIPSGAFVHALLELAGWEAWTWLVDLPMAVACVYLTWAWRFRASLKVPILAMLHIGFAWLGVALLLYGVQSMALLEGQVILGRAPLHALTIGYFSSMLLGMLTRVTLGHSGRILEADKVTMTVFLIFQMVAVLRITADIPGVEFAVRGHLYLYAAVLWLVCFGIWAYRFAGIYWKPRADGMPG